MTRHRSPRDRSLDPATTVPTAPFARSTARHRSPGRSAVRHGALALGITGTALAAVAPAALQVPAEAPATAALALSTQGSTLASPTPARATGAPVTTASRGGAASADLIKASDRARATTSRTPAPAATTTATPAAGKAAGKAATAAAGRDLDCGASGSYGGVKASVRTVGHALECVFPGHDMLGVGSRGNTSDHPGGYALDMMTTDGDAIAKCVVDHADALGVSYVIWNQRINTGSGWKGMADRGGATANHEDHVHISFRHGGDPDVSVLRSCG